MSHLGSRPALLHSIRRPGPRAGRRIIRVDAWDIAGCALRQMTDLPTAVDLRVEHADDPLGIDEPRPRLSWRVVLVPPATRQSSFEIEVAREPDFAPALVIWSRSDVAGSDTAVVYDGPPAGSRERRFWRVRVVDDRGSAGSVERPRILGDGTPRP